MLATHVAHKATTRRTEPQVQQGTRGAGEGPQLTSPQMVREAQECRRRDRCLEARRAGPLIRPPPASNRRQRDTTPLVPNDVHEHTHTLAQHPHTRSTHISRPRNPEPTAAPVCGRRTTAERVRVRAWAKLKLTCAGARASLVQHTEASLALCATAATTSERVRAGGAGVRGHSHRSCRCHPTSRGIYVPCVCLCGEGWVHSA